jgi:hypothetical protein
VAILCSSGYTQVVIVKKKKNWPILVILYRSLINHFSALLLYICSTADKWWAKVDFSEWNFFPGNKKNEILKYSMAPNEWIAIYWKGGPISLSHKYCDVILSCHI